MHARKLPRISEASFDKDYYDHKGGYRAKGQHHKYGRAGGDRDSYCGRRSITPDERNSPRDRDRERKYARQREQREREAHYSKSKYRDEHHGHHGHHGHRDRSPFNKERERSKWGSSSSSSQNDKGRSSQVRAERRVLYLLAGSPCTHKCQNAVYSGDWSKRETWVRRGQRERSK